MALALSPGSSARARPNPFLADRLRNWIPRWTLAEIEDLQEALSELDFVRIKAHCLDVFQREVRRA